MFFQLRAQANVLKKAVVEEQTRNGQLKETTRLKDVELRRSEQENDSLTFRNKQLELRVATLQDELEKQGKQKRSILQKATAQQSNGNNGNVDNSTQPANNPLSVNNNNVVTEELHKKIVENAQLVSLLADKSHELEMCQQDLQQLQEKVNNQLFTQSFVEEGLRHEIQELQSKIGQLETRFRDEDNRSVTTEGSSYLVDTAPVSCATEDRIVSLEKELSSLRAKCELLEGSNGRKNHSSDSECSGDRSAEQLLFEHFTQKVDEILLEKQLAESKLVSYLAECDNLKDHLEILTDELRDQERRFAESQRAVQTVEDQLQTTRLNYQDQISVLTEQVLSLSDQLAAASL